MKRLPKLLLTAVLAVLAAGQAQAAENLVEMRWWNHADTVKAYAVLPADEGQGGFELQLAKLQDEVLCVDAAGLLKYQSSLDHRMLTRLTPKDIDGFILKTDDGMEYKFVSVRYEAYSLKNRKYLPAKRQFLMQLTEDEYSMFMAHRQRDGQTSLEMAYSRSSSPRSVKSVRGLDIAEEFGNCELVMKRLDAGDYREDDALHLERRSVEAIRQIGKAMAIVDYLSNCR